VSADPLATGGGVCRPSAVTCECTAAHPMAVTSDNGCKANLSLGITLQHGIAAVTAVAAVI
jgi:hypothetical protein